MLVASLALQQIREVGAVTTQKEVNREFKNSDLYKFGINSFWSSDVWSSTLQKIKAVQRIYVLKCSENHDIYFGHTILCTYKTL